VTAAGAGSVVLGLEPKREPSPDVSVDPMPEAIGVVPPLACVVAGSTEMESRISRSCTKWGRNFSCFSFEFRFH